MEEALAGRLMRAASGRCPGRQQARARQGAREGPEDWVPGASPSTVCAKEL